METRLPISDSPSTNTPALMPAPPADTPISLEVRQRCIALAGLKDKITVSNSVQYEYALDEQKKIRNEIDAITASYEEIIRPARQVLDGWYEDKRLLLKPLQDADIAIGRKALDWKSIEDAKAEQERQRLQNIANAKAEADRQAELKAIEKEQARAKKAGDFDAVNTLRREREAVAASPLATRTVQVESRVPDVAGMAAGKKWTIDEGQIDVIKLAEAVYRGWCSPKAIEPGLKFLNQQAKSNEADFNKVDPKTKRTMFPGVTAYNAGSTRRT